MIRWLRRKLGVEALEARLAAVEARTQPHEAGTHANNPDAKRQEVNRALSQLDTGAPPPPPAPTWYVNGPYL